MMVGFNSAKFFSPPGRSAVMTTPMVAIRIAITFSMVRWSPRKTKPKIAVWIASVFRYAVVTTNERSFMASSIRPVARIWLSAPSSSHGQNGAVGHGTWSPVAANTIAKKTTENGKPNKKRILVAPQVPSGPVNCRCIALRATCPNAAVMVKGIQSVAMLNMWGDSAGRLRIAATVPVRASAVHCQDCMRHHHVVAAKAGTHTAWPMLGARRQRSSFIIDIGGYGSLLSQGRPKLNPELNPLRHHHVVHVHVGGEAPA